MTFTQLLYFTTVVKYNSITKAAKSLYVSQPAVSLAIKQLEEEFWAVLFLRNNNQLELTEEGKYFNTLAIRLLDEYKNVEERMHRYVRKAEVLRIGIPPMLGAFLFPPILEEFSKEHPDVQVELTEYGSIQNRRAVENHEIDIALTVIEGDDISKNLEYQKIGRTHLIFMVDKNSRLAGRTSLDIEDIADEPLVIMKQDCLQAKIVFDEYKKHNINPNVGAFVAVDYQYHGLIPRQDMNRDIHIATHVRARVSQVRNRDHRLILSPHKQGYKMINTDGAVVMRKLKAAGGFLPYGDKTPPAVIGREFGLSKGAFKRAIGHLQKRGKLRIGKDGIHLL